MSMYKPEELDLTLQRVAIGDQAQFITKITNTQRAFEAFSAQCNQMIDSIQQELDATVTAVETIRDNDVIPAKNTALEAAQTATERSGEATASAQQAAGDRQAVADDRAHIDQQKQATDTTAGQVSQNAQQVASDRQAVAYDRLAAQQSAGAASDAAVASEQAKNDAQALYGDLQAVEAAKTASQQAAQNAGEERALAVNAREGAESAQQAAEDAAQQAVGVIDDAATSLEKTWSSSKVNDLFEGLGTASSRDVPETGDAATDQVVKGDDTRLSDARTPTAHNHSASEITAGTLNGARLGNPTSTVRGGVKVRLNGTTAYITSNGSNA